MSYSLIQLAPGAYDLFLADSIVASVVRSGLRQPYTWTAELLEGWCQTSGRHRSGTSSPASRRWRSCVPGLAIHR